MGFPLHWILASLLSQSTVVRSGDEFQNPRQPQLAVAADGAVHLTFGDGNRIYYARSASDSPLQFSKPVKVAETPNMALGMRRGPRVASAGKNVVVSAISGVKGRGRDENLLAWRSDDGGKTWQGPATVNDSPAAAREGLHAMVASPNGGFACAWIDLRSRLSDVRTSTSMDGRTWSRNEIAYQSPSGRVCECCQPSLAFDERGRLHLLWRNSLDGFRDMHRSVSEDGGKTFGPAVKLGSGSWTLNACPMDGGAIAVRDDKIATVWRRERVVYATIDDDRLESRIGDGEQPCIAATSGGSVIAWLRRRPGSLLLKAGRKDAVVLADDATDPVLVSTPDFKRAVIAWEGKANGRATIEARVIDGEAP